MQPRLPGSKRWTDVPREFIVQVEKILKTAFSEMLGKDRFVISGRIYPEEILMSFGVEHKDQIAHAHFEISIAYKKNKDNVLNLLNLSVDAAGALFSQYWDDETNDHDFPRIWQEIDFESRPIYVQFTTKNNQLEKAADTLLGVSDETGLTGGEWGDEESESPEQIKARLGIADDDDDDGGSSTVH